MSEEVEQGRPDGVPWAVHLCAVCPLTPWSGTLGNCLWCDEEIDPYGDTPDPEYWCSWACRGRYRYNHDWPYARNRAINQNRGWCSRARCRNRDVEVNHIVPLVGRGYHPGCVHHQSNLEVLCREHHVIETTRQLRERRGLETETREALISEIEAHLETVTYCGAMTGAGKPCSRWVDPGTRCWQHVGQPLAVEDEDIAVDLSRLAI